MIQGGSPYFNDLNMKVLYRLIHACRVPWVQYCEEVVFFLLWCICATSGFLQVFLQSFLNLVGCGLGNVAAKHRLLLYGWKSLDFHILTYFPCLRSHDSHLFVYFIYTPPNPLPTTGPSALFVCMETCFVEAPLPLWSVLVLCLPSTSAPGKAWLPPPPWPLPPRL